MYFRQAFMCSLLRPFSRTISVLAGRIGLAHQHRQQRIVPQGVMVIAQVVVDKPTYAKKAALFNRGGEKSGLGMCCWATGHCADSVLRDENHPSRVWGGSFLNTCRAPSGSWAVPPAPASMSQFALSGGMVRSAWLVFQDCHGTGRQVKSLAAEFTTESSHFKRKSARVEKDDPG